MNSVVFVGNHISTKDHELGDLIDSHDTVVRFGWSDNSPERKKYMGGKTDVWVTSQYDPIRAKQKYDYIFQYSFLARREMDPVYSKIAKMQYEKFGKKNYLIFRPFSKLWMDMENYLRLRQGLPKSLQDDGASHKKYSSALSFAWLLLHHGTEHGGHQLYRGEDESQSPIPIVEQISIYGFDWWGMGGDRSTAVSTDGVQISKEWNSRIELDVFGALWLDGKIRDLNPDSDFHYEPRK